MTPSEEFFYDFGNPVLEEGVSMDYASALYGGSGGFSLPEYDASIGWTGSGINVGIGDFNANIPISGPGSGSGPDVKEILTSIANSHESALKANLGAWQQKTISGDAAIDRAWQILNSMTANMLRYGTQGRVSAAERDRRIDPAYLKWDYIAYYIDPISAGTTGKPATVQPLPVPPVYGGTGLGQIPAQYQTLLLVGLVGLIAWKVLKKK